jgi:phage shock protein E
MKAVKMRIIIGVLIGGGIGFLIGYFGKCASGTCPLTSNPIVSTIIGALLGGLIAAGK